MNKLIIIRGNSGSGKTTVAEKVREQIAGKVALVGQDNLRRTILREEDSSNNNDILGLLEQTVKYCLDQDYTVILEGILSKPKYGTLLANLTQYNNVNSYVFYMDVSFEETIRRHQTKPTVNDFGEKEMRQWYQEKNYLKIENEIILPEKLQLDETIQRIIEAIQ